MLNRINVLELLVLTLALAVAMPASEKKKDKADVPKGEITEKQGTPVLWREPADIGTRNLLYGSGGPEHQPRGPFTFVEEDFKGSNPKFDVEDAGGVKWKVKLGAEARPEVVASRFLWAVGYMTDEDYFMLQLPVEGLPKLHRGNSLVQPGGVVRDVRLKKRPDGYQKLGTWEWAANPFSGTREFNGLRVMMALINNWDLKDINNAVYARKKSEQGDQLYVVTDLGGTFGTAGLNRTHEKSKGNLESYTHSRFIDKVRPDSVDFGIPDRPAVVVAGANPHEFLSRLHLEWIGKNIPREDVRWMAKWLARLSPQQIRDAFRAGGYSPDDVEGFARMVETRIYELNQL